MKVHIICSGVNGLDNRILHRLARLLEAGTGWGLGEAPDLRADVNYAFPYLDAPIAPCGGLTAAWFTHRDTSLKGKVGMWDRVAEASSLRLTSAKMYLAGLSKFGPSCYVTPPLDHTKFRPVKRKTSAKPVVGVSGYTYRGGRKGESLIRQLVSSNQDGQISLRAAGRGWPVPTKHYEWSGIERFYQTLDVYLLPSSIEGVGYGPLEALACGVPVVIPRGVGVMDELPDIPGIERYEAGDYKSMVEGLWRAIERKAHPDDLEAAVERFTEGAWVQDHKKAIDLLLGVSDDRPAILPERIDRNGKTGLYVVAYGDPSRRCAVRCIESFKRHMPDVPVALCSDRRLGPEDVLIQKAEIDIGARSHKIHIDRFAPADWKYVLYLDADTETVAPIGSIFEWLKDGWELVICKNPGKFHLSANMGRSDNSTECSDTFKLWRTDQMMQWNGGVFGYRRCEATRRLFDRWISEWDIYGKRDQAALLRALWHEPVRAMWLGNEWNLVPAYDPIVKSAGIIHHPMTARRWKGIISDRSDSPEAWRKVREFEQKQEADR